MSIINEVSINNSFFRGPRGGRCGRVRAEGEEPERQLEADGGVPGVRRQGQRAPLRHLYLRSVSEGDLFLWYLFHFKRYLMCYVPESLRKGCVLPRPGRLGARAADARNSTNDL